jgi:tRNA(Ile)-lysidine synthase
MILSLEKIVFDFLNDVYDCRRPLLLGFSGGPDSLTLLHLLLKYRESYPLTLGLAHVDHRWREESSKEATRLAKMAEMLSLPFHLKTLDPETHKRNCGGNREAACRRERLKFFAELTQEFGYQAVLLAHHADDQAETVLKRILEGANLPCLYGLRKHAAIQGLQLWRPLLGVAKDVIRSWLDKHFLIALEDRTNLDPKFLRGKFRTSIIPQLARDFGKEIRENLCRLGSEANELRDYLDNKVQPYIKKIVRGNLGLFLDLNSDCPDSLLELKHLIRKCCENEDVILSREMTQTAAIFIQTGVADKQLILGKQRMYIDRKRLFLMEKEFPLLPAEACELKKGSFIYGNWQVHVMETDQPQDDACSNWKSFWYEGGEIVLPANQYVLVPPQLTADPQKRASLYKKWTNNKVPAFIRLGVPVIGKENTIVHEFLTGRVQPIFRKAKSPSWIKITLRGSEC